MNLFREIADLYRFRRTPAESKRVVFYAEHEGYYSYFEGLLHELTDRHQVPVCYVTSDPDDPVFDVDRPRLRAFYINKLLPFFMRLVKSPVFVMTLTDLNRFHLKRSLHPVHYVYVFHSMVSTHMMYRAGAFDHYDSILCVGPHHVAEIRADEKARGLAAKKLVEAGYYRLERIYSEYLKRTSVKPDSNQPATVLIASSWGEHNLLTNCGAPLVERLLNDGYRVIVRPHPETSRREPKLPASLQERFGANSRFVLETSVATDDSLLTADILICDLSGVALEYALGTERPVLFVDLPPKVHNDAYRQSGLEPIELARRDEMGEVVPPDDPEQIMATMKKLLLEREEYRPHLKQLRNEMVYHWGHSAEVGAQHIMQVIDNTSIGGNSAAGTKGAES